MFQAILGPVANLVGTYIKGKQEKAKLKTQVELTKLEATKKQIATNTAPVIQKVKRIVSSMLPQFDATSVHHHGDQK